MTLAGLSTVRQSRVTFVVVVKVVVRMAVLAADIAADIEAAAGHSRAGIAGCMLGTAGIVSRKDTALSLVVYPSSYRYGASPDSRARFQQGFQHRK